ncbi:hypothetical protein TBLA_0E01380 [Henningerozyma blattae CBS 6284]|uniref:Glycerol uptake/efflux facilitator protein n=1 Tax=Henningerozyma blattae (strain ATCC 34711 / CBS 6284 / DSM 70876 / NBRC 10599 / NRRL Y-10934 / UCD 77-7) TaxID=1071380 RepID=I2H495_HENB6|nr:hypothetical protein TBLA_0E01380 [Tetrapisispora blattae CBS 6284]CCH61197.1 hypothetical protein TBLA_0E01380 [Tetrapisispora blattae CBS 6284]
MDQNDIQHSTRSSIHDEKSHHNDDDSFDYEMQEYSPIPMVSTIQPTTTYIPQYSVDSNSAKPAFPIQEVIPNSHEALTMDINSSSGMQLNPSKNLRARTSQAKHTTSSSIHSNSQYSLDNDIDSKNDDVSQSVNRLSQSQVDSAQMTNANSQGIPMMVKPKTLYQNPQTPTVLPSTYHPISKWSTVKHTYLKEFLAEFMGTMVMIIFGDSVCCQVNLASKIQQNTYVQSLLKLKSKGVATEDLVDTMETLETLVSSTSGGTFDDIAMGWGAAVVMGYFCAGGSAISGAHLNPSITIANFFFRGFPKKKIPYYLIGQMLGAFIAAYITFIYHKKIILQAYPDDWWKNESVANLFFVFPKEYLSPARQFIGEFVCTAMLQAGMFALTDPYTCLSSDVFPLMLFILIFMINASMGYQTGCAMNMARDLGPRLAMYTLGFDRKVIWINHHHFFWIPMVAPFLGSLTGALVYDVCIYQGHESPVNWPFTLYKEKLVRSWHRRPGWKKRSRKRATSDLSEFSYATDDIDNSSDYGLQPTSSMKKTTTTSTASDLEDEIRHPSVQFKSVQKDAKRLYGGIPTILENEDSLETASFSNTSGSLVFSDKQLQ